MDLLSYDMRLRVDLFHIYDNPDDRPELYQWTFSSLTKPSRPLEVSISRITTISGSKMFPEHTPGSGSQHAERRLVPRQAVSPGRDGYRTPTIEDYERSRSTQEKNMVVDQEPVNGEKPPNVFRLLSTQRADNRGTMPIVQLSKLEWHERIRHYTWTWFTMTMATGGIANVLYTGIWSIEGSANTIVLTLDFEVPFRFRGNQISGIPSQCWNHSLNSLSKASKLSA